jgi:hypothetical protein
MSKLSPISLGNHFKELGMEGMVKTFISPFGSFLHHQKKKALEWE